MVIPANTNINSQASNAGKAKTDPKTDPKAAELAKPEKQSPVQSSPVGDQSSKDSVSLSSTAISISNLETKVANSSAIDRTKVEEIKASISEGTYRADADKIALAILKQEELIS